MEINGRKVGFKKRLHMAEGFRQVLIQLIQPRLPFLVGCGGSCHRNGVGQGVIKAVPTLTDIWVWYNDVGQVVSCQVKGFAGGSACNEAFCIRIQAGYRGMADAWAEYVIVYLVADDEQAMLLADVYNMPQLILTPDTPGRIMGTA